MKQTTNREYMLRLGKFIVLLLLTTLFVIIWRVCYTNTVFYPEASFWQKGNLVMTFLYAGVLYALLQLYRATEFESIKFSDLVYSLFISILITDGLAYIQLCLMTRKLISIYPMLLLIALQFLLATLLSYGFFKLIRVLFPKQLILIITSDTTRELSQIKTEYKSYFKKNAKYELLHQLPNDDSSSLLTKYDLVIMEELETKERKNLIDYCSLLNIPFYVKPTISDVIINNARHYQLMDSPAFYCTNSGLSLENRFLKRTMDLLISLLALVLLSPFMLLIALCIKIEDGGPIIYRQTRLTRNGKTFSIMKFRSMIVNAEVDGVKVASQNDNRITKVGAIIRKYRLDETPQLLNVLKGEMSIVGPRPERPEIAKDYEKENPLFRTRLKVKAGLTGYAQVYGKYNSTLSDKLILDSIYIERYSFFLDIIILFLTFKILFQAESTEGFEDHTMKY